MNTLLLTNPDQSGSGWDLSLDSSGNLAVRSGGIAIAQDVASACRTFLGECWYDAAFGAPYYGQILGRRVSLQFVKRQLIAVALTVPGVASVRCFLTGPGPDRVVGGQIQITGIAGETAVVRAGNLLGAAPWWVSGASEAAVGAAT